MQSKERIIHHEILDKLWEINVADTCSLSIIFAFQIITASSESSKRLTVYQQTA